MANIKDLFQWQTETGEPTTIGDVTLTTQSQALILRWPYGGFVWNRPVAVLVERGEHSERIPITDVTRMAQWGLLGLSIVFSMITLFYSTRQRRTGNE
jgi:hypothetical protein